MIRNCAQTPRPASGRAEGRGGVGGEAARVPGRGPKEVYLSRRNKNCVHEDTCNDITSPDAHGHVVPGGCGPLRPRPPRAFKLRSAATSERFEYYFAPPDDSHIRRNTTTTLLENLKGERSEIRYRSIRYTGRPDQFSTAGGDLRVRRGRCCQLQHHGLERVDSVDGDCVSSAVRLRRR